MALSSTGHTSPAVITKTLNWGPMPNVRMANGINTGGGIARRNSAGGPAAHRTVRKEPITKPKTVPATTAMAYPASIRSRLGTTSLDTRANSQLSRKLARISVSGGEEKIYACGEPKPQPTRTSVAPTRSPTQIPEHPQQQPHNSAID